MAFGGASVGKFQSRTYVESLAQAEHVVDRAVDEQFVELGFVVHIQPLLIAYAPKFAWERIEVEIVFDALSVAREYVVATNTDHVESDCGNIAIERYIGWSGDAVGKVVAIESGGYEPDAEFGVGRVVWSAYDAEIEFLIFLGLVGVLEVVEYFLNDVASRSHAVGGGDIRGQAVGERCGGFIGASHVACQCDCKNYYQRSQCVHDDGDK